MQRCLELARQGEGQVSPNPMVGAVVVHEGKIIGEGWHRKAGQAHAEVNAIADVGEQEKLSDSTLYVSLEPCVHHGKTPPCVDLILEKKIPRVVIASRDENPTVSGKGVAKLKAEGVSLLEGVLEEEAKELNKRFFTFHRAKRPYILLKWAQTLDGYIDIDRSRGEKGQHWITGPETRRYVHQLRKIYDCILVGQRTVVNDNPSLGLEEVAGEDPLRLILDPNQNISPQARVFRDDHYRYYHYGQSDLKNAVAIDPDKDALKQILEDRYVLGSQSILVEGGAHTINSFIKAGLWDEAIVLVGEQTLGSGLPGPQLHQPADRIEQLGNDRILYYRKA